LGWKVWAASKYPAQLALAAKAARAASLWTVAFRRVQPQEPHIALFEVPSVHTQSKSPWIALHTRREQEFCIQGIVMDRCARQEFLDSAALLAMGEFVPSEASSPADESAERLTRECA
jgi:hypothetical protein